MKFSDRELGVLRDDVKKYVSARRYNHILGVEKVSVYLGEILLPNDISELRAAALLHDVSKELPIKEQIRMIESSNISLTEEDLNTEPALHSFSAVPFVQEHFTKYATPKVLSAVAKHTLGSPDMSVFDKIVFIADFIEPGRTYDECIRTSEFVHNNILHDNSLTDNLSLLDNAVIMAIDYTIESIKQKNESVHSTTLMTRCTIDKNRFSIYFKAE